MFGLGEDVTKGSLEDMITRPANHYGNQEEQIDKFIFQKML